MGFNAELMGNYIEYVADGLLQRLSVPTLYGTQNPVRAFLLQYHIQLILLAVHVYGNP